MYEQVKVVAPRFGNEKYFRMRKLKKGIYTQSHFLNKINLDDWHTYKSSEYFREASKKEVLEMKYSQYVFFSKEYYKKEELEAWSNYLKEAKIGVLYIHKPLPPVSVIQKINIKQ